MFRNLVFFLIFLYISLFADHSNVFEKKYMLISLGNNCWTASAIKSAGLRDCAFPFDWLFTLDDEGLNKVFDDDFQHFTNEAFFSRDNYNAFSVRNNYYGMIFIHDWPFNKNKVSSCRYKQHLKAIKIKYERRIARFRQLQQYDGKVYFFRTFSTHQYIQGEYGWNTEKARKLKDSLDRYFPNLDFTLVILSCTDAEIPEVNKIDGIIEFKIKDLYVHNNYLSMFKTLLNDYGE